VEIFTSIASSEVFTTIIGVFIGAQVVFLLYKFWFLRSLPYHHRIKPYLGSFIPKTPAFIFYYVLLVVLLYRNLWNNFVTHTGTLGGLLFVVASILFIFTAAADHYETYVKNELSSVDHKE
jgi:uncharacterized membrane protein YdjX (TVP38/TMEM64 family)